MSVVVLYCPERSAWVRYDSPHSVFAASRHGEVPEMLARLEAEVERTGLHAAGFLAYEAGHAFDQAMPHASCAPFPLAWFGLFEPPQIVHVDVPSAEATPGWVAEMDAAAHGYALAQIRRHLAEGETYQVNFTYRLRAPFTSDPWNLFRSLVSRQPSPHGAFVDIGDFAVCCASPEMFFWRDGLDVWSRPMKGTAPRGRWAEEDAGLAERLAASEKERAENVMIVDMVRNDLGRVCLPGSVHVPELFRVERYPTLWQLTSLVHGRSSLPTAQIMAALFPAASITGAPKVRTMQLIRELEISPRRIYTGTIGVMTPGRRARFNVAIRTVLVDRERGEAEYGVGGGIVWDSEPAAEYEETRVKARVLATAREAQADYELLETMRWSRGEGIALLGEHMLRLGGSAAFLGFTLDADALRTAAEREAAAAAGDSGVLRLSLRRDGSYSFTHRPVPVSASCRVALAATPVHSCDPLLFHKTTRRNVYARALAEVDGVDDALLWNEKGELTESTIANIVVELDGVLLTPSLKCGLLPGTLRAHLLRAGRIREGVVRVADLPRCTGLWLISAVRGWRKAVLAGPDRG